MKTRWGPISTSRLVREGLRLPLELRVLKSTPTALRWRFSPARARPRNLEGTRGPARVSCSPFDRSIPGSMDIPAQKQAIRRAMVERILALDPDDRRRQEADLTRRLATLPGFEAAGTVLLYVSAFPEEIATGPALRQVLSLGKRLVCPRVDRPARRLRLYRVDDPEPTSSAGPRHPRAEPTSRRGRARGDRLGPRPRPGVRRPRLPPRPGRGYYDRLLPTLRPDAPRWALASIASGSSPADRAARPAPRRHRQPGKSWRVAREWRVGDEESRLRLITRPRSSTSSLATRHSPLASHSAWTSMVGGSA